MQFRALINKAVYSGVYADLDIQLAKKVILTNKTALGFCVMPIPLVISFLLAREYSGAIVSLLSQFVPLAVFVLNRKRCYHASRVFIIMSSNLIGFWFATCVFPAEANFNLGFFMMPVVTPILFEVHDRGCIALGAIFPFILYLLSIWARPASPLLADLPTWLLDTVHAIIAFNAFWFIFFVVYQFLVANAKAETELRENQALLVHTNKMAALGEMAGGMAHEVNNPLTIAQLAMRTLEGSAPKEPLEIIDRSIDRIAKIVSNLRAFARDVEDEPSHTVEVRTLVDDALSLCSEKFKHEKITLRLGSIPETLKVECRPGQIGQILFNLMSNARDAVQSSAEKWISVEVEDQGQSVDIRISDSGQEIAPEFKRRLFQPFFTTKEVGKGVGLGLSVSRGIAEMHHGSLILDPNRHTTSFVLRLPKRA